MEIISIQKAKEMGLLYYFTGKPCKHGHISKRAVLNGICYGCLLGYQKNGYWKNPEKEKQRQKNKYREDPEKERQRQRDYHKSNPTNGRARAAKRFSLKKLATPEWADLSAIKAIYAKAKRLTEETGVAHHVDHIIPLQGKNVTGLHIPENLRIITASENQEKYNYTY